MTENARHPVDVALRAVTTTLEPRSDDFDFARARLMEAIATDPHQNRGPLSGSRGLPPRL